MRSCLIVDDTPIVRKMTRRIMEDFGFYCTEAADGQKARDTCENKMPDIIILDWNMPNMNGLEFIKILRAMEKGRQPIVLFCTVESHPDFMKAGLAAGADEYITKPFDRKIIQMKFAQLGLLGGLNTGLSGQLC